MLHNSKILGVDIGGTNVACGLVSDNCIINEYCINISSQKGQAEIIEEILFAIEKVYVPEVEGIGVGAPGLIDARNGIVYQLNNIPSWKEVYLKKAIEDRFHRPVYVNNDANCFAVGEKYFGKGQQYEHFLGLVMGTGLVAGIIINNHLYSGVNCGAGEFGSIPFKNKLLEYYCSGQFFLNEYKIAGSELYKRGLNNDTQALNIFDVFGAHMGEAIKIILYALAPQAIILGGSVSKSFPFFEKAMWKSIEQFPFKMVIDNLLIEKSSIEGIAILGAAALYYDATK